MTEPEKAPRDSETPPAAASEQTPEAEPGKTSEKIHGESRESLVALNVEILTTGIIGLKEDLKDLKAAIAGLEGDDRANYEEYIEEIRTILEEAEAAATRKDFGQAAARYSDLALVQSLAPTGDSNIDELADKINGFCVTVATNADKGDVFLEALQAGIAPAAAPTTPAATPATEPAAPTAAPTATEIPTLAVDDPKAREDINVAITDLDKNLETGKTNLAVLIEKISDQNGTNSEAILVGLKTRIESLKTTLSELDQARTDLAAAKTAVTAKNYSTAADSYKAALTKVYTVVTALSGEEQDVEKGYSEATQRAFQALREGATTFKTNCDSVPAPVPQLDGLAKAAETAATAPTEAAPESGEFDWEVAMTQMQEALKEHPQSWLKIAGLALGMLFAAMQMMGDTNGLSKLSQVMTHLSDLGEKPKKPEDLFKKHKIESEDTMGDFMNLKMSDLVELTKKKDGKPSNDVPQSVTDFKAEETDEFSALTAEILDTNEGRAFAEDPDNADKTLADFLTEERFEAWKTA